MHSLFARYTRKSLCALLFAFAALAGCHHNDYNSGYGIGWVTLTAEPSNFPFTSYVVTIDSITLTGQTVGTITAVATAETVDLSKLNNIAELWASANIPNDTYTSAVITLDYTDAVISVLKDGVPTLAGITDPTGAAVTTVEVTMNFDPQNLLTVTPTPASTSATRLAIDINLAASNLVGINPTTNVPYVVVRPYATIGIQSADTKLIRVRGPLVNTSLGEASYSVYVRPFYDEVNSLGSLSLFSRADTIFAINGSIYDYTAGINALSQLSAGTTMTAAYTTFVPDLDCKYSPCATAGTFYPVYVIGGSTLEDYYTDGLSGYVTSRIGNTLTLSSSTLIETVDEIFTYESANTQVILGSGTLVTADGTSLANLTSQDIGVGQYIAARGLYTLPASGIITLDATGTTATNTGSVRIMPTEIWGTLESSQTGGLTMDLQTINDWPAAAFNFAGNGSSQTPTVGAFSVDTGSLPFPAGLAAGDPVWIYGRVSPFGSAPPDFIASSLNSETSVQVAAGTDTVGGTQGCGQWSSVCEPARMVVWWGGNGTGAPFAALTDTELSIDLKNTNIASALIQIGPENIDMRSLSASPQILPTTLPVTTTFAPRYSVGNTSTADGTTVTTATTAINVYSSWSAFVLGVENTLNGSSPAVQFEARGVYNRASNTFTANSVNVVL